MRVWPGRPYPLGGTWDGAGVNFAIFSEHAVKVELCLFDSIDDAKERHTIPMREHTDKPVKYLVLSHYHAVRVLGASAFEAQTIVAHEQTRRLIAEFAARPSAGFFASAMNLDSASSVDQWMSGPFGSTNANVGAQFRDPNSASALLMVSIINGFVMPC